MRGTIYSILLLALGLIGISFICEQLTYFYVFIIFGSLAAWTLGFTILVGVINDEN